MFVCSVAASVERRDLLERGAEAAGVLRAQRAPLPRPAAAPPPGGGAQEDEAASHLQPGGDHQILFTFILFFSFYSLCYGL